MQIWIREAHIYSASIKILHLIPPHTHTHTSCSIPSIPPLPLLSNIFLGTLLHPLFLSFWHVSYLPISPPFYSLLPTKTWKSLLFFEWPFSSITAAAYGLGFDPQTLASAVRMLMNIPRCHNSSPNQQRGHGQFLTHVHQVATKEETGTVYVCQILL